MTKTAVITGVTGQDGSYLADLLLSMKYNVIGIYRRSSTKNFYRIDHLLHKNKLILEESDLTDPSSITDLIIKYRPQEFYNLAAQSHVGTSFSQPTTTFEIDTIGVINILESIRKFSNLTKFYQASTSEMFGENYSVNSDGEKFQDENTPFLPQSPYGVAKMASHRMVQIYRSAYGMFACSGILFNHESPRRGDNFVTKKITKWIGEFVHWKNNNEVSFNNDFIIKNSDSSTFPKLRLGNLDAYRDWGHAKDYVKAMWTMLQQHEPKDYVICTGVTHSIKQFLDLAFMCINIQSWKDYVVIDEKFYRPAEVDYLRGCSNLAQTELDWNISINFKELVEDMVYSSIKEFE